MNEYMVIFLKIDGIDKKQGHKIVSFMTKLNSYELSISTQEKSSDFATDIVTDFISKINSLDIRNVIFEVIKKTSGDEDDEVTLQ